MADEPPDGPVTFASQTAYRSKTLATLPGRRSLLKKPVSGMLIKWLISGPGRDVPFTDRSFHRRRPLLSLRSCQSPASMA